MFSILDFRLCYMCPMGSRFIFMYFGGLYENALALLKTSKQYAQLTSQSSPGKSE